MNIQHQKSRLKPVKPHSLLDDALKKPSRYDIPPSVFDHINAANEPSPSALAQNIYSTLETEITDETTQNISQNDKLKSWFENSQVHTEQPQEEIIHEETVVAETPKEPEVPLADIPEFSPAWEKDADALLPKPLIDLGAFDSGLKKHNIYDSVDISSNPQKTDGDAVKSDNQNNSNEPKETKRQVNISDMMMNSEFSKVHEEIDSVSVDKPFNIDFFAPTQKNNKPNNRFKKPDPFATQFAQQPPQQFEQNQQYAQQPSNQNYQIQPNQPNQQGHSNRPQFHSQLANSANNRQTFGQRQPQNKNIQQPQQFPDNPFNFAPNALPAVDSKVVPKAKTLLQIAKERGPVQNQGAPMPTVFANSTPQRAQNQQNRGLNPVETLITQR